ncbi:MAG: hypothetical protein K2X66_07875 [Cyanobacteria bacterium]|nr:hypothetical protein [Cyanobacteriota bacterium]
MTNDNQGQMPRDLGVKKSKNKNVSSSPSSDKSQWESIYLNSQGIETFQKEIRGAFQKHIRVTINSEVFDIPCGIQTEVPLAVAEILRPILMRQVKEDFNP